MASDDEKVIGETLWGIAEGPFIPDWEFPITTGLEREEMHPVADEWPQTTDRPGRIWRCTRPSAISWAIHTANGPRGHD
jgi:hypothetical protein